MRFIRFGVTLSARNGLFQYEFDLAIDAAKLVTGPALKILPKRRIDPQ